MKVTPEEAQAFRDRVKKQWEEFEANWVVIPIDDAIEMLEEVQREAAARAREG